MSRFPLETSAPDAKVRAADEAATNEPRLPDHNCSGKERIMADDGCIPSVVDVSTTDTPNVGELTSEINDNWQHISSPVARIVARVLRSMEERDHER